MHAIDIRNTLNINTLKAMIARSENGVSSIQTLLRHRDVTNTSAHFRIMISVKHKHKFTINRRHIANAEMK